jgi:hypothetical protein
MAQAPKGGKGMGSKQPAGLPKGKVGNCSCRNYQ